jgi:hypothetical protein
VLSDEMVKEDGFSGAEKTKKKKLEKKTTTLKTQLYSSPQ